MPDWEEDGKILVREIEAELRYCSTGLDYKITNFALRKVGELTEDPSLTEHGYHWLVLLNSGYGKIYEVTTEEILHAKNVANLAPGDTTLSAYWIDGSEGAQCLSLSKAVRFDKKGNPLELLHLWPLDRKNLAIDINRVNFKKINRRIS